jgi:hypothetical protein
MKQKALAKIQLKFQKAKLLRSNDYQRKKGGKLIAGLLMRRLDNFWTQEKSK